MSEITHIDVNTMRQFCAAFTPDFIKKVVESGLKVKPSRMAIIERDAKKAKMKAYRDSLPLEHARVKPEVEAQWESDREEALKSKGYTDVKSIMRDLGL